MIIKEIGGSENNLQKKKSEYYCYEATFDSLGRVENIVLWQNDQSLNCKTLKQIIPLIREKLKGTKINFHSVIFPVMIFFYDKKNNLIDENYSVTRSRQLFDYLGTLSKATGIFIAEKATINFFSPVK